MNVNKTIQKLTGHSENLLMFYLGTVRKYSILDPMLFLQEICDKYGARESFGGYIEIRETLYYSVIQNIANMFYKYQKTNPSILRIKEYLSEELVASALKQNYISEPIPDNEDFRSHYEARKRERMLEFDEYLKNLIIDIETLEYAPEMSACKSVRDKFTAHLDLQSSGNEYSYPDIATFGITYGTPKKLLAELRPVIERIGNVVRGAGFAWDSFDSQNNKMADGFWSV